MSAARNLGLLLSAALPLAAGGLSRLHAEAPNPPDLSTIEAPLPRGPAPAPATPPPPAPPGQSQCLARFAGSFGLPVHSPGGAGSAQTVICRQGYALSFNAITHNPDWVIERLTPGQVEHKFDRADGFEEDPLLGSLSPTDNDYDHADRAGQKYQRGHQAPAEDFASNEQMGEQSFFFSNMSPQIGGFNVGIWRVLEGQVRKWVTCTAHDEVFVITGPIYRTHDLEIGTNRIWVPKAYYKIVYDPKAKVAVGFILDNAKATRSGGDFAFFAQPIDEIERETGLDFFSKLRRPDIHEAARGIPWGHMRSGCVDPAG